MPMDADRVRWSQIYLLIALFLQMLREVMDLIANEAAALPILAKEVQRNDATQVESARVPSLS